MDGRKKSEYIGILGALLVHVAVIALLILVSFAVPQPDEDAGGVPVMLGNVDSAHGFDDPSLVDVDILPEEAATTTEAPPELPSEQDLLTQTEEATVALKPKAEPKKETVKPKEVVKPKEPVKKPEKTAAEKAAEAKRIAEEKAEREQKAAEEAAKKKVANAFGKGSQMNGSKGTADTGTGTEGSKEGNSSTGAKTGTGGIGKGNTVLSGRDILYEPKPVCDVKENARVMVDITVSPEGKVITAKINLSKTNTQDSVLQNAALEAARKTRFNAVKVMNNQQGTITYNFNVSNNAN